MASRIEGITIDIGGNTSKLQDALKGVNKQIYSLNADLKDLSQALKLDPKNTELLSQKQDVLKRNIEATTSKLNDLKEAQKQMGSYSSLTDEQKSKYIALEKEIANTEKSLKSMQEELNNTSKVDFSKLKDGLKNVGDMALDVSKKLIKITAAVSAALTGVVSGVVKQSVEAYAEFEQLSGGIDTLFGTNGKTLEEYAKSVGKSVDKVKDKYYSLENAYVMIDQYSREAYKTAGLSANEYMSTITSFSAALVSSLKGDTEKAADVANQAIIDMSDNANKMGTDMSSIQSAYQGFAKQNYNMLDNLKLGYGGNKKEMERLIADANKLKKAHGETAKLSIESYADVVEAIHTVQTEMGITGTTAKEASTTIQGSIGSMKAAWQNFVLALSQDEGEYNITFNAEALMDSISTFLDNIVPRIKEAMKGITVAIGKALPKLAKEIGGMLFDLIPDLLSTITEMLNEILSMLTSNTEGLKNAITTLINNVVLFITENLPTILNIVLETMIIVAQAIVESIPTIVPAIVDCVIAIADTLLDNIDLIIDTAIELIIALVEAMTDPNTLEKIIKAVPKIILALTGAIIKALPKIIDAGFKIVGALLTGIGKIIDELPSAIWDIIVGIYNGIVNGLFKVKEAAEKIIDKIKDTLSNFDPIQWGKDMIEGLANGIKGAVNKVKDAAKGVADKIKSLLHFSRPDEGPLREYETWMPDFVKGLASSLKKASPELIKQIKGLSNDMSVAMTQAIPVNSMVSEVSSAMRSLNYGISNSVNPTINPNITVDQNYQLMAQAMKEALNSVDVVLDDRQVGRFVQNTITEEIYGG